jgi:hypothetical protein
MTDKTFFKPKWRLLLLYTKTIIKGSPAGRANAFGLHPVIGPILEVFGKDSPYPIPLSVVLS